MLMVATQEATLVSVRSLPVAPHERALSPARPDLLQEQFQVGAVGVVDADEEDAVLA